MSARSPEAEFEIHQADMKAHGVSTETFRALYRGAPAWEIGRPQTEISRLLDDGAIAGRVLDAGCGTGENALMIASRGHAVLGIDAVPEAIDMARDKAARRGVRVEFRVHDALEMASLRRAFDVVVDSGLFHGLADHQRPAYVAGLAACLESGGVLCLLCFSDLERRPGGPRRVSLNEIRGSFAGGWTIEDIRAARFDASLFPDGARAWRALIRRA